MKKAISLFIAVCLLLSGCGKEIKIDVNAFADELLNSVSYEDELSLIDNEMAFLIHDVSEDVTSIAVYLGSLATAEEIAVFEAKDNTSAKKVLEKLNEYVGNKRDEYQDYIPKEVKRIDNAIVEQNGKYIVLCITNDTENAKNVIGKYFN